MHRRNQGNHALVPFDPKIEAAARRQSREARRKKRAEVTMIEDQRVLRDYALPQASGITSFIVSPAVEANTFELSPELISFVEREQFDGHPSENPNAHLRKFLAKCNTIKINGASSNAIRLRPFPFSLRAELVIGCLMKSPTHSPPGRCSPRPSLANIFHRARLQS